MINLAFSSGPSRADNAPRVKPSMSASCDGLAAYGGPSRRSTSSTLNCHCLSPCESRVSRRALAACRARIASRAKIASLIGSSQSSSDSTGTRADIPVDEVIAAARDLANGGRWHRAASLLDATTAAGPQARALLALAASEVALEGDWFGGTSAATGQLSTAEEVSATADLDPGSRWDLAFLDLLAREALRHLGHHDHDRGDHQLALERWGRATALGARAGARRANASAAAIGPLPRYRVAAPSNIRGCHAPHR